MGHLSTCYQSYCNAAAQPRSQYKAADVWRLACAIARDGDTNTALTGFHLAWQKGESDVVFIARCVICSGGPMRNFLSNPENCAYALNIMQAHGLLNSDPVIRDEAVAGITHIITNGTITDRHAINTTLHTLARFDSELMDEDSFLDAMYLHQLIGQKYADLIAA